MQHVLRILREREAKPTLRRVMARHIAHDVRDIDLLTSDRQLDDRPVRAPVPDGKHAVGVGLVSERIAEDGFAVPLHAAGRAVSFRQARERGECAEDRARLAHLAAETDFRILAVVVEAVVAVRLVVGICAEVASVERTVHLESLAEEYERLAELSAELAFLALDRVELVHAGLRREHRQIPSDVFPHKALHAAHVVHETAKLGDSLVWMDGDRVHVLAEALFEEHAQRAEVDAARRVRAHERVWVELVDRFPRDLLRGDDGFEVRRAQVRLPQVFVDAPALAPRTCGNRLLHVVCQVGAVFGLDGFVRENRPEPRRLDFPFAGRAVGRGNDKPCVGRLERGAESAALPEPVELRGVFAEKRIPWIEIGHLRWVFKNSIAEEALWRRSHLAEASAAGVGAHVEDAVAIRRQREASAPRAVGAGCQLALQRSHAVRPGEVEHVELHLAPLAWRKTLRGQLDFRDLSYREEVVRRAARHRLKGRLGGCRAHQARHRDDK